MVCVADGLAVTLLVTAGTVDCGATTEDVVDGRTVVVVGTAAQIASTVPACTAASFAYVGHKL